ncbi:sensor histidine kinase [Ruminococcus sp.]|uniref:sensor histidine kinase n=1 Tax=Ruminococcus sp. TaxID=41978 RepID=UPI002E7998FB|nr:HAMP domain-containing sensor histidine kinase [Ruminococcus sp.]MEE1262724.1 HAMP domain-containing sensor histidine kinase [Ruminococcus sp.]
MMKEIRQRFIRIALLALTLAMLLVAGSINIVHLLSTQNELNTTLDYLVEYENSISQEKQKKGGAPNEGEDEKHGNGSTADSGQMKQKGHNHMQNTLEESRYFMAILRNDGELMLGVGSKETDCTEEEQLAIAENVFASESLSGRTGNYIYRVVDKTDGARVAIFLNCESKYSEVVTLALISLSACVAGILLAWLVVFLLSNQAIKPMVENIERQKQFITDAGHELKTPLTVISANMDVLSMDIGPNEWVRGTQKQVSNMRKLVNELIYLSRMDEADSHLERNVFNLSGAVSDVSAPFAGMAEFNGKNLILNAEDDIKLCGDEQAVRRLISTLCENAVKHAPEDSDIVITLIRSGKNAVFSTENATKEPLDEEALTHLFDRFYRGDASRSKEENTGFGIGLSIARAITEKHGGSIKTAVSEDGRLQITCTLPLN